MSSSNCCFLTCIQISQEPGQVVWFSPLFKNFTQFVVIYTVKGFVTVHKPEVNVFLEHSCFFDDPIDVANLVSGSSAFSKSSLNIWKFLVHPSDRGAWWAAVYGVTQSQTRLKWLSSSSTIEAWLKMQYLDAISKMTEWSLFVSKEKHSVSQ